MNALPGGFDIDYRVLLAARASVPLAALAILAWDAARGGRRTAIRDVGLGVVGVLSFIAWWNFGALHGRGQPIHVHDVYHYYLGSKYYAELGYTRIYQCTAVAEVQRGRAAEVGRRWSRNLVTNDLQMRLPTRQETAECLTRFSDGRWKDFGADVEWFRDHHPPGAWQNLFSDRGYNATPVWSTLAYWLARWGPATDARMLGLASIDVLAILMLWAVVWRTFGWRVASVALTWWGVNEGYGYLGGAFLRNDAYVLVVLGICALKARRPALAGAALASASLLRIFPIVLLAGLGVKVLVTAYRQGLADVWRQYRRVGLGFAVAAAMLVASSALTWAPSWGGALEPWRAFADNTRRHVSTPTANQLGLRALLSLGSDLEAAPFDAAPTASETSRRMRWSTGQARQPLYWTVVLAFGAIFALRARFLPDWMVLVLAVALLPIVVALANYYYSILLVFAFLWPLDRTVGVGLVALASFVRLLPALIDTRADGYLLASAGLVAFSAFVLWRAGGLAPSGRNPADLGLPGPLHGGDVDAAAR